MQRLAGHGTWTSRAIAILVAGTLVSACGGSTPTRPVDDDPPDGPPITVGTADRDLEVSGHPRVYRVHVPGSVDLDAPARVMMVLHGYPPIDMAPLTGMNALAEERGFVTVYPRSAYDGEWVHACRCTPTGLLGVDDIAYFDAILADLRASLPGGLQDAFVAGFSNGGMMTYTLACRRPEAFAGFGVVGGGMWTVTMGECHPPTAPALTVFAGTADPQFPWEGMSFEVVNGAIVTQEAIPETLSFWAERNGCAAESTSTPIEDVAQDGTTVERITWTACAAPLEFWRIEGGGHTWPGQEIPFGPALGRVSRDIVASERLVAFWMDPDAPVS